MTAATVELRLVPDLSPTGFLRKCYDEWVEDADYYRAHPEEDCPADYLKIPPFEQYVAEIAEDRVAEIASIFGPKDGFAVEVAEVSGRTDSAAWLRLIGWFALGLAAMGVYVYLAMLHVALLAVWPLLVIIGLSIFKCWTARA